MTDNFPRNIAISIGLHVAVLLVIFFQAVLIPRDPIDLRNAIRVDVVDLPKKMATLPEPVAKPQPPAALKPAAPEPPPEPPKAEPAPVKPEPVATPKAPVVPKAATKAKPDVKKSQSDALNRLKRMSAIDKIKQEVSESNSAKTSTKPAADAVAGNKVSSGNSLTGLERIDFNQYLDEIKGKVNANLSIPQWLADTDLRAQVQVLIDERGYITKREIKKSSNNDVFDAKVIEAIDASSPLPAPPARLRGVLSTSGITFNFPE